MTEREYNELEGVRRSDLWKMNESPEKYKYALEHPMDPTPALSFGSATHKLILEDQEEFNKEYAVAPVVDKRTSLGKEIWNKFAESNEGKTIISEEEYLKIVDMNEQICNCPLAEKLIHGKGETETMFLWHDEDTDEICKVKLDRLVEIDNRFVVVDYKTAASAQTDKFVHEIFKYGYHLQAAMYTEGVMICRKLDYRPDFIFVVQEKQAPYSVNVIYVASDSGVMMHGIDTFREFIGTLHRCKELDQWPGYLGAFGEMNEAYLPGYINLGDEE